MLPYQYYYIKTILSYTITKTNTGGRKKKLQKRYLKNQKQTPKAGSLKQTEKDQRKNTRKCWEIC